MFLADTTNYDSRTPHHTVPGHWSLNFRHTITEAVVITARRIKRCIEALWPTLWGLGSFGVSLYIGGRPFGHAMLIGAGASLLAEYLQSDSEGISSYFLGNLRRWSIVQTTLTTVQVAGYMLGMMSPGMNMWRYEGTISAVFSGILAGCLGWNSLRHPCVLAHQIGALD